MNSFRGQKTPHTSYSAISCYNILNRNVSWIVISSIRYISLDTNTGIGIGGEAFAGTTDW
ncbi:MAG: hypothetical protein GX089_10920 [Fibrobacter sp.]|nr:hypothetical protein [Fibrobacter sp.]